MKAPSKQFSLQYYFIKPLEFCFFISLTKNEGCQASLYAHVQWYAFLWTNQISAESDQSRNNQPIVDNN